MLPDQEGEAESAGPGAAWFPSGRFPQPVPCPHLPSAGTEAGVPAAQLPQH